MWYECQQDKYPPDTKWRGSCQEYINVLPFNNEQPFIVIMMKKAINVWPFPDGKFVIVGAERVSCDSNSIFL